MSVMIMVGAFINDTEQNNDANLLSQHKEQ